ncbi:PREDICTED: stress response protein NST1 [Ipomoea nil]|uniref:stress response protein NST1 n=1 Tax=Ipomoea nil TaxID=35883 RepID=UPI000901530B|nr:PREDICTED: stress response protein NST1 [Ipomoea nil]
MSLSRHLLRNPISTQALKLHHLRSLSATAETQAALEKNLHQQSHKFLAPSEYLNSWKPPRDPKEAEAQLALLRREYAKKVKVVRKDYIKEMEVLRLEKLRKAEAKKEALRIANEERKAAKAAEKKAKAEEIAIFEEEFRRTLLKERQEKLEYWRMRETKIKEKKTKGNELLRRKSSLWIDEEDLEAKLLDASCKPTPL